MRDPRDEQLESLHAEIRSCSACALAGYIPVANPVFRGHVSHRLMVIGQAPGERGHLNATPYAGATGKTLRSWLVQAGFAENDLYDRFYLTSVTKCFPGPSPSGKGDRAPSKAEIHLCQSHLNREIAIVQPEIILALGRLSIQVLLKSSTLTGVVGTVCPAERAGHRFLVLPLPHPSGVSHWLNDPVNKHRLGLALEQLSRLRQTHNW